MVPEVKINEILAISLLSPTPERHVHRLVKAGNIHQARLVRELGGELDRIIFPVQQFASETEGVVPVSQVEIFLVYIDILSLAVGLGLGGWLISLDVPCNHLSLPRCTG